MITQVENTPDGYIVGIYLVGENGVGHWHWLRNFGERQGDAFAFRDWDLSKLCDSQIRMLIKQFNINTKYIRLSENRYAKV